MDSTRLSPDFPYDTLIARANAEHAAVVHHPLDAVLDFVHGLAGAARDNSAPKPETAVMSPASDDAALADAQTYADLRRRFNEVALLHNQIPLDPTA